MCVCVGGGGRMGEKMYSTAIAWSVEFGVNSNMWVNVLTCFSLPFGGRGVRPNIHHNQQNPHTEHVSRNGHWPVCFRLYYIIFSEFVDFTRYRFKRVEMMWDFKFSRRRVWVEISPLVGNTLVFQSCGYHLYGFSQLRERSVFRVPSVVFFRRNNSWCHLMVLYKLPINNASNESREDDDYWIGNDWSSLFICSFFSNLRLYSVE
jgi:hypothetical protein